MSDVPQVERSPITLGHVTAAFCRASGIPEASLFPKNSDVRCDLVRHYIFFGARLWTDTTAQSIGAAFHRNHSLVFSGVSEAAKRFYAESSPMKEALRSAGLESTYLSLRKQFMPGLLREGYRCLVAVVGDDAPSGVLLHMDPTHVPLTRLITQGLVRINMNTEAKKKLERVTVSVESNALLKLSR